MTDSPPYDKYFDLDVDINTPEYQKWMEEKGIKFDSGDIVIEIDGKKEMINTSKDDFGTHLLPETIEEKYGKKKREELGM